MKETRKKKHEHLHMQIERNVNESLQHINCLLYYAYYYPYIILISDPILNTIKF